MKTAWTITRFLARQWRVTLPLLAGIVTFGVVLGNSGFLKPALAQPRANCTYAVQPGDELHLIAQQFGKTQQQLADWNHIANPDLIYVGQRLTVCGGYAAASQGFPQATPAPDTSGISTTTMTDASWNFLDFVFNQDGHHWSQEARAIVQCESGGNPQAWNPTPVYWPPLPDPRAVLLGHASGLFQITPATFQGTYVYRRGGSVWNVFDNIAAAYEIVKGDYNAGRWRWNQWSCSYVLGVITTG